MTRFLLLLALMVSVPAAMAQSGEHAEHSEHSEHAEHAEHARHADHAMHMSEDHSGVHAAVLDYLEGIYNVEPERIERSVSTDLVKWGWWRPNADTEFRGTAMNFEQLHSLAGSWNTDNRQGITADSPREIVVMDVLDQTAAAKLTAHWGIDYFHLEKVDGRWMIRQVMWQSPPAEDS